MFYRSFQEAKKLPSVEKSSDENTGQVMVASLFAGQAVKGCVTWPERQSGEAKKFFSTSDFLQILGREGTARGSCL